MRRLQAAAWPGNVRELRNTIERLLILVAGQDGHRGATSTGCCRRGDGAMPAARRTLVECQTFEEFKQEAEKSFLLAEAAGARLERVGDGARARHAAVEPLQEDRAVRPDPGDGMTEPPRDWDKELAKIDKVIEKARTRGARRAQGRVAAGDAAAVAERCRPPTAARWR